MISLISTSYFLLYSTVGGLAAFGLGFSQAVKQHSSSATAAAAFDVALNLDRESMGLY
jgi:hypothetical protein